MTENSSQRMGDYLATISFVAVASYVFGRLGQTMAEAPVYATILWPPSGIALGMMLVYGRGVWPGVFLAAVFLNSPLVAFLLHGTPFMKGDMMMSLLMSSGAALQALLANWMIRRNFALPVAIRQLRDAALFLLLAGPLGCLLSPSVGVTALYVAGTIEPEAALANWLTWWAGDVFGVIVFMPLTLLVTGSLPRVFALKDERRLFPIAVLATLVLSLCVTLGAWKQSTHHAAEKAESFFRHITLESERALQYRMASYEQSLLSGVGLFAGSDDVSRQEWKQFAAAINVKKRFPGINGIGFVAKVEPHELDSFVRRTRLDGAPDYHVHPDIDTRDYFLVKFIEPDETNHAALGYNVAVEAHRREAAEHARDTGMAAVTRRIVLVHDTEQGPGFVLMLPFYASDKPVDTVEERRAALKGWVAAPFVARRFMNDLTVSQGVDFHLTIYDGGGEDPKNLLYASGAIRTGATYVVRKVVEMQQQRWTVVWRSTKSFERKERSNEPLIILFSGLLFTGLLGMLLMMQAQRTDAVERMVEMRTAELTEREAHLAQVVDKLTESNVELERFAYIVSHDMQEPVRMVANFSSLLFHQYQDRMDPAGQKYLGIITEGARRLQAMISDLLEYARVGQGARGREPVNATLLLQYVLENLNFVIYEHEAQVTHGPLPDFQGYPVQFMSLLQNLVNNAIKYQPPGGKPVVHVSAEDQGEFIQFSVRDNGIGIGADNQEKIFEPFKRLHTYQQYSGTGLGLAVCKKIVANHGGRIWVDSTPGQGSTFYFTILK